MSRPYYVLHPGSGVRANGRVGHVTAGELARLYGVPLALCIVHSPGLPRAERGLKQLVPRADGDYRLGGAD